MIKKFFYSLAVAFPVLLFAFSSGPVIKRTGAPVDGGIDCTACHRTFVSANSDPKGSILIEAANYIPGETQQVKVTIKHPDAVRWGFQLTARPISDQTKQAGTFTQGAITRVRCDPAGNNGPCNGALEFVEHADAPFTDAGAGFTFQVDWTPPATNAGDVIFYAAGNAANGDGTLNGDRIYTTSKTISPTVCNITGKPSIVAVGNAASFQPSLSPNTLLTIFGLELGSADTKRLVSGGNIVNNAFPQQLACLAVEVDGKRVPVTYVQSNQINAQAPVTASRGPVSVRVMLNPDTPNQLVSNTLTTPMVDLAPAFFTLNGKSIAAQFAGTANVVADPSVLPSAKTAKPGDVVTLYGTGFGPTDPAFGAGAIASGQSKITTAFTITIGGAAVPATDVTYLGVSPGSISGLYQINVKIPAGAADGDLPVVVQMGGLKTQDGATIPVKK
ncbi:MAG: IPT/TIG domain-containing protein [Acidobacteriota bacterium]|nr:IPT/TIG domain-containing protein [Acidobacteriota bacterium]